jgi:hypothetical protein
MNFYPFVVLFLAEAVAGTIRGWGQVGALALLSFVFSKVWLPMDHDLRSLWLERLAGETSSFERGPWIDHAWYLLQGGGTDRGGFPLVAGRTRRSAQEAPASGSLEQGGRSVRMRRDARLLDRRSLLVLAGVVALFFAPALMLRGVPLLR